MRASTFVFGLSALIVGQATARPQYGPTIEDLIEGFQSAQRDLFGGLYGSTSASASATSLKPETTKAVSSSNDSKTASTPATTPVSSTPIASVSTPSSLKPASSSAPSKSASASASSVKPTKSASASGSASSKPASSALPSKSASGSASSIKPISSSAPTKSASASASSVKPTKSASASASSKPAGTSAPSKSASGGASSIKPISSSAPSKSASASASSKPAGTSAPSKSASGGASSIKPISSSAPSKSASASASSVKPTRSASASASSKPAGTSAPSESASRGASSIKPISSSAPSKSASASASSKPAGTSAPSKSASGGASSIKPASSSAPSKSASGTAVSASCLSKPSRSSVSRAPHSTIGTVQSCLPKPSKSRASSRAQSGSAASSRTRASTGVASTGVASASSAPSSAASSADAPSSSAAAATSSATTVTSVSATVGAPSATISAGTILGATYSGIDEFLAIPYAQPPVGDLRLKPPVPFQGSLGTFDATTPPYACPQFAQKLTGNYSAGGLDYYINKFVFAPTPENEDCLTINVYRPHNTTASSKLPVLYWIYGGGWEFGSTSMFNGSGIVAKSVELGAPIVFVEVNYRLGGFGFLAGKDLAAEGSTNLGLRDQRLGLQWTADNVAAFGGDPDKVTLWGESAGAISACYQLTVNGGNNTYKGKPLFRGSIHDSGSIAPADNTTAPQAQAIYDTVVERAGCKKDTATERLACLRSVDYTTLHNATNSVPGFGGYRSADLSYLPRPDQGDSFYATSAEFALAGGAWTKTPFIIGDQEDEGTLLAIAVSNLTTNDQLVEYVASWFPNDPTALEDAKQLASFYPDDVEGGQPSGSPFGSGSKDNVFPQYKRLAAILGDIVFILTRRAFLQFGTGQGISGWSYLNTYLKGLPTYGTLHGADLAYLFDPSLSSQFPSVAAQTYYISFVNYLDPNKINTTFTATNWPQWNASAPQILNFTNADIGYINDTFRNDVYNFLVSKATSLRV